MQMTTVSVLPENDLIYKFMQGLHGFMLNWIFLDFLDFFEKNPSFLFDLQWFTETVLTNKKNPEHI